jgi:hypothetical protein
MSDEATIRARQSIRRALVQTGALLVGTLLLTVAHKLFGWIDNDTTTRALMVLFGLFLAAMGNTMPKQNDGPPSPTPELVAVRQSITRVGGRAMLIGGLVWAVLWAFAPRDVAQVGGILAIVTAVIVMLVHAVWRFRAHRRSSAS